MAKTLPTHDELVRLAEASLRTSLDPKGTGRVNLRTGSNNAALVSVVTQIGMKVLEYAADRVAARELESSRDQDLDDVLRDRFKTERVGEAYATGRVYLIRTGTAATTIPKGSRVGVKAQGTQKAVAFVTTSEDVPVAAGVLTASAAIRCTESGIKGNVSLASVTEILDPLPDNTWAINPEPANPEVIGGGSERENDDEAKARARQIGTEAPPGTIPGVLKGAGEVGGVKYLTVVEPFDGTIVLYVGDAGYKLPTQLRLDVLSALEAWRGGGMPVLVRAYTVNTVAITSTVYMARKKSNFDEDAIKAAIVQRVKHYFDSRAQADEYYVNAIEAAHFKAHDEIQQVVLAAPVANVVRPQDVNYGAVTALNRYVVATESINITISDPLTT